MRKENKEDPSPSYKHSGNLERPRSNDQRVYKIPECPHLRKIKRSHSSHRTRLNIKAGPRWQILDKKIRAVALSFFGSPKDVKKNVTTFTYYFR